MEIGSPGTRRDMVQRHENCDGYQCIGALEDLTQRYIQDGYPILQDSLNGITIADIAVAIDRDTHRLARATELWRSLHPPEYPQFQGDATMPNKELLGKYWELLGKYWELLDEKVGAIIDGTTIRGVPFSTSADPLLSASKFGKYTAAGGGKHLGVIIKFMAPKGTPVIITNPNQAEYIIGSGHALRIEWVQRDVPVTMRHFQNCDGTDGKVEKLLANRVIGATLRRVLRPGAL